VNVRGKLTLLAMTGLLLGSLLLLAGCEERGNEYQRLVCEIDMINDGVPLVSGYRHAGQDRQPGTDDDYDPIDNVVVQFHARPYSSAIVLPADAPYSYFHVTEYDVIWHPLTVGGEELPNYNIIGGGCDVLVPVNGEAAVSVLVADRYMKEQPFFRDLMTGKAPFTARCELRFRGHETGSDQTVELRGSLMVNCVAWVIEAS
jgi:hypothetical protein